MKREIEKEKKKTLHPRFPIIFTGMLLLPRTIPLYFQRRNCIEIKNVGDDTRCVKIFYRRVQSGNRTRVQIAGK